MSGGAEEFDQALAGDRRRPAVHQGVKVEHRVRHHGGIEDDAHPAGAVVDGGERSHRAGLDAERLAQELGGAEREAPRCAQEAVQRFELDRRVFQRDHEEQRTLFVAQKQVLGVPAGHLAAQRPRFLDREHRRMAHGLVRDAETIQVGEKLVRRGRHGRAS